MHKPCTILEEKGAAGIMVTDEAMSLLRGYRWPGNTRELSNVLERALLLAAGSRLGPEHFPALDPASTADDPSGPVMNLEKLEQLAVKKALKKFAGDTQKAAEALGISRATLYRKIKQYDIKI